MLVACVHFKHFDTIKVYRYKQYYAISVRLCLPLHLHYLEHAIYVKSFLFNLSQVA